MTYPAVPDMRIPYDNDGSVVANGNLFDGVTAYISGSGSIALNSFPSGQLFGPGTQVIQNRTIWYFFPEQREVTAFWGLYYDEVMGWSSWTAMQGSNDTTNGLDGTWETATVAGVSQPSAFAWRSSIVSVSFTGPKKNVRTYMTVGNVNGHFNYGIQHYYGGKAAGQTPDDIVYLDGNNAFAQFTSVEDFGDVPLGTTSTRTFKVKNVSPTKTANTINIQCNDSDFAISSDGVTWVVTINIASLAAGASSGTLYVRNTAPSPGNIVHPRYARIVTTVASYT